MSGWSVLNLQACYGHTEGAAGITGAFLAITALRERYAPGIVGLRNMNPYVAAALGDWEKRSGRQPLLPRTTTLHCIPFLAGDGLFPLLCQRFAIYDMLSAE